MGSSRTAWPRQSQRRERSQVHLCIDSCGLGATMAEKFTDLRQRRTLPKHLTGEAVTELVSPFARRIDSGTCQSVSHKRADARLSFEPQCGRSHAQKDAPTAGAGPSILQIVACETHSGTCRNRFSSQRGPPVPSRHSPVRCSSRERHYLRSVNFSGIVAPRPRRSTQRWSWIRSRISFVLARQGAMIPWRKAVEDYVEHAPRSGIQAGRR